MAMPLMVVGPAVTLGTVMLGWYRSGRIRMTPPLEIRFGTMKNGKKSRKVALRTTLHVRFHWGKHLHNIYVELEHEESKQTFPVWYYGEKEPKRGGGFYVEAKGEPQLYQFLLPDEGKIYEFRPGKYHLKMFIQTKKKSRLEFEQVLEVTPVQAHQLKRLGVDIVFTWLPTARMYTASIDNTNVSAKGRQRKSGAVQTKNGPSSEPSTSQIP